MALYILLITQFLQVDLLMRINIINILGILLAVYVLVNIGVYVFQQRIIYQPHKLSDQHVFQLDHPWEEFFLPVGKKDSLHTLLIRPKTGKSKGVVVYFHGNRGNLARWAHMHTDFTSRGFDFLVIDYRGYGRSSGKPSERNIYQDGVAAYQWAAERYTTDEIIIYGRSLGTGVATYVAALHPACFVGLETPFFHVRSAMQKAGVVLWLPFKLRSEFRNDLRITRIEEPVHIFQGTRDRIVPYGDAVKLKPLLKPTDSFTVLDGGEHNDLSNFVKFQERLEKLLMLD